MLRAYASTTTYWNSPDSRHLSFLKYNVWSIENDSFFDLETLKPANVNGIVSSPDDSKCWCVFCDTLRNSSIPARSKSSTLEPLMPTNSPRRNEKYSDGSLLIGTNSSLFVRCSCKVICYKSPASLRPYKGFVSSKHSSVFKPNAAAWSLINTLRARGSVDCKYTN